MKLIRHILSHSILIGFVASLVLGFYYRAALFPSSWNEQISQQVERVGGPYAPQLHAFAAPVIENTIQVVAEAPLPEPVSEPTPAAEPEVIAEVATLPADVPQVDEAVASEVVADPPAATEAVVAKPVEDVAVAEPVEKAATATVMAEAPATDVPVAVTAEETVQVTPTTDTQAAAETVAEPLIEQAVASTDATEVVQQQNKQAAAVVAQAPAAVTPMIPATQEAAPANEVVDEDEVLAKGSSDQDFIGIDELWLQARAAYGRGDLATATQHYLALSEQQSDNPDVFGELGNVYYARGNFPQAGEAYYKAAIRLLELGQMGQMQYLVRVIEGLSPDNAAKLKQRLMR